MDTIGIDLHTRESQLCRDHDDGTVAERRIATTRERFTAVLGARPRARMLLEASTESEWVARHLESLGHEVIVADPHLAPMDATRSRRTKADRRDARTLREACRLRADRPADRLSDARRHIRAELAVREALVRTRTRYIALAKALVRRDGPRVPARESHLIAQRIVALELSESLPAELLPAHHRAAFLGVVPGEYSSGEKRRIGRITKAGNARARYLLVEAGWRILRSKDSDTEALRAWALTIAARRGTRIAVVALARRLAGMLYAMWHAMWRDQRPYDATRRRLPRSRAA